MQVVTPGNYIRLSVSGLCVGWRALPMASMGNNIYAATLPAEWRQNRTLIRYRVEATDATGHAVAVP